MLLQVGQLGEALGADVAMEGPLARVGPKVHLQIGQLAKGLETDIALVMHFAILLLQRVRQRSVAARAPMLLALLGRQAALVVVMVVVVVIMVVEVQVEVVLVEAVVAPDVLLVVVVEADDASAC